MHNGNGHHGNGSKAGRKPFVVPEKIAKLTVKELPDSLQKALTYTAPDQWPDIMTIVCQNAFMGDVIRLIGFHFEIWSRSFAGEITGRGQVSAHDREATRKLYEDIGREVAARARKLARKANVREPLFRSGNKRLLEKFAPPKADAPPAAPPAPAPADERNIPTRRLGTPVA